MRNNWAVLVKPTNDCNLDCEYCFEKESRVRYAGCKMDDKMISHIVKMAAEFSKEVQWIWHGGEPTLMGPEWYEHMQKYFFENYNTRWVQKLQTNGILLENKKWMDMLKKTDILVGVSYDAMFQNIRTKKDVDMLDIFHSYRGNGVRLGAITVINDKSIEKLIDMYEFYKKNLPGSMPSFNIVFSSSQSKKNNLMINDADKYMNAFMRYYKYWLYDTDDNSLNERLIDTVNKQIMGAASEVCTEGDCRDRWLGINSNGDIKPCDRDFIEDYSMGNIMDYDKLEDVYLSPGFSKYYEDVDERIENICKPCGYLSLCNGGCNGNHVAAAGSAKYIDEFGCEVYKRKFNEVYDLLRTLDIYSEKINRVMQRIIAESAFMTIKEITDFLKSKGISKKLEYFSEGKEIFNSVEYKVFRVFNPLKRTLINSEHYDVSEVGMDMYIDTNYGETYDFNSMKEARFEHMETIYNENEQRISTILEGGN